MILGSTLQSAHHYIRRALSLSDRPIAIDATLGNGNDTLFLAEEVGTTGKIYGFDIQLQAIQQTQQRLQEHQLLDRVHLIHASHHTWTQHLPSEICGQIQAIMFNLGYLPHGNSDIITQSTTTLPALTYATEWLAPGGIITVALYTGHPGGEQEANDVLLWSEHLPPADYQAVWQSIRNRNHAPSLLTIEKKKKKQ